MQDHIMVLEEQQLKKYEGYRKIIYHCPAGKLTVGYGRNVESVGLSQEEALYLLRDDIKRCQAEYKNFFGDTSDISDLRQATIIDMIFNLGMTKFKQFKNLIAYYERRDFTGASQEMLNSTWAEQFPLHVHELAYMMRTNNLLPERLSPIL